MNTHDLISVIQPNDTLVNLCWVDFERMERVDYYLEALWLGGLPAADVVTIGASSVPERACLVVSVNPNPLPDGLQDALEAMVEGGQATTAWGKRDA